MTATPEIHLDNARLRIAFLTDCAANGMPPKSVDQRRSTTAQLIRLAGPRPLASFDIGGLNALIVQATHMRTGASLSAERLRKIFNHARELMAFVCATSPSAAPRISQRHLKNLSANGAGVQSIAPLRRPFYELDELLSIARMKTNGDWVLDRAQAAACLQFLSGMRVGALASLPLEALDLSNLRVHQWTALGVRTKGNKSASTALLDLPELLTPVRAWFARLSAQLPGHAMFFNVFNTLNSFNSFNSFGAFDGATHWQLTDRRAGIYRNQAVIDDYALLCKQAGIAFKGSHALRHGHIVYCARRCRTPTDFMALSQNVMHADERMTRLYAMLDNHEVAGAYTAFGHTAPADIADAVGQIQALLNAGEIPGAQRKALKSLAGDIVEAL
jgi:integrase